MSAMKCYAVILELFEKDDSGDEEASDGSKVKIVTFASSLADASAYAVKAYEKADGPMTDGFHWEVVHAEQIEGKVALPAMREIVPHT